MKHLLSFAALLALLATSPLLSGCSKKDDPAATTGTMSGTVAPVGSIAQVTAKTSAGISGTAAPDATSGAFSFASLAPGSYTLSFTTATGYKSVADRTVSIVAGQNTAIGTVQATSDGSVKSGTMSWTVNSQTYTTTAVTGLIDTKTSGSFGLTGRATAGTQVDELGFSTTYSFTGSTGTYSLSNNPYSGATYQRINNGVTAFGYSCNNNTAGSNGNFIVTQYDATAGTAAGTFGFVGAGSSGTATVSNGTFSIRF